VLLIYANRRESDIVFRQELAEVEAGGFPSLKVVHVLSQPGEHWPGETGRLDSSRIQRLCEEHLEDGAFYVCGPRGLLHSVRTSLRGLGVAKNRIHFEIFSFPN
jgi:ring-1,2-phenylacetyl-CoA epoxidase subunit PaaE